MLAQNSFIKGLRTVREQANNLLQKLLPLLCFKNPVPAALLQDCSGCGGGKDKAQNFPFIYRGLECELVPLLWKSGQKFLENLEVDELYDPYIPFLCRSSYGAASHSCLLLLYSQQPGNGNSLGVHQLINV